MMRSVSAHTDDNRMTASAVAACMAPLLLRPLLAGECMDDEAEVSPDNAAQLLAATAAANNAQSIVTTLLEEYDHIFEVSLQMLSLSPNLVFSSKEMLYSSILHVNVNYYTVSDKGFSVVSGLWFTACPAVSSNIWNS